MHVIPLLDYNAPVVIIIIAVLVVVGPGLAPAQLELTEQGI